MKTQQGFTLIELMIVVGIIALVSVIGYPVYKEQTQKARRSDAKVALVDAAQTLERCRTNSNTYVGCTFNGTSPEGYYTITAPTLTASTYTLTATATGSQAGDTSCATFSLTHTGSKTATSSNCW